jgi:hypothetical protein
MSIDKCEYSFTELATSVLPRHFERLKKELMNPIPAEQFVGFATPSRRALSLLNRSVDFPGCYVFVERDKPVYVGISRKVIKRLVQHINSASHYSASLVYRIAFEDFPHEMRRDQAMKDDTFRSVFFSAQNRLRQMSLAAVEVKNDLELYLFEVYAAMRLDTSVWNTFRTH